MLRCPCCGVPIREREDTVPELDLLIADSVELAVPGYGRLLAHYATMIEAAGSAGEFFDKASQQAHKPFLLGIGGGLYEGLVQAAMLGRGDVTAARGARAAHAARAVTDYRGAPIELDWFRMQGFTVAGVEQAAVLAKLKERIEQAVAGDATWDDFRRTAQGELKAIGVEISEARLETVFGTNLAGAHGAGKWLEGQAAADVLPYWMYETVLDSRVRPAHAAQQGKVYPKNHPYWSKWFPPNGYNCRCTVSEWDRGSLERAKIRIESEIPADEPDSGFGRNPADVRALIDELIHANKLSQFAADNYDLGPLPAQDSIVGAALGLTGGPQDVRDYEGLSRTVTGVSHPRSIGTERAEGMVREAIESPSEVWGWQDRPLVYLKRYQINGRDYVAVVEILGNVERATVVEGNGDAFRRGILIKG